MARMLRAGASNGCSPSRRLAGGRGRARAPPAVRQRRGSGRGAAAASGSEASPFPPATYDQALQQARAALRRVRADRSSSAVDGGDPSGAAPGPLSRLTMEIPVPPSTTTMTDPIEQYQESDWPGGPQQRHRYLRPLVEDLLEGYSPEFVGLLEDDADGLGVWKTAANITAASQIFNATFPSFMKLCRGEYGKRVLAPGHVILAINSAWTEPTDIGQFWDRKLKTEATSVMDQGWQCVYCMEILRTSNGINGTLYRSYPGQWQVYLNSDTDMTLLGMWAGRNGPGETSSAQSLVLEVDEKPTRLEIKTALTAAKGL